MHRINKTSLLRSSAIASCLAVAVVGQSSPARAATVNQLDFQSVSSNGNRCVFGSTRSVTGVINDSGNEDQFFLAVVDTGTGQPSVTGPVGRSVTVGQTSVVTEAIISFAAVPRSDFEIAIFERVGTAIGAKLASDPIPRGDMIAAGGACSSFVASTLIIDAGADQTVTSGDNVTLDATGSSDPEGDSFTGTWTQTSGPTVALSSTTSAQPSFAAPAVTQQTIATFVYSGVDATGISANDTVAITINPTPNIAPTAEAGPDQTVAGGSSVALAGSANDGDNDPLTFQWTQTGGPTVALTGDTTLNPSFTAPPRTFSAQTLSFELAVNDGTVTVTDNVTITVAANLAPTANAGQAQTVAGGANVTLDGTASSDPEGDALVFGWVQASGPSVVINGGNTATATFTAPARTNSVQTLEFVLRATDTFDASDTDRVIITIPANQLPLADAGPDQTLIGGANVTLDGSGSTDPEGDPIVYNWVQTGGPAVNLVNATSVNPTFVAPQGTAANQVLTFQLTVSDTIASNSSGSRIAPPSPQQDTVQITILANNVPLADAGQPQTVDGAASVTLDGSGSTDPDGDPLTYSWVQTGGPTVTLTGANSVAPSFTAPPKTNSAQALTFELTVNDPGGASSTASVTITVTANELPTADAGPDQSVSGASGVTLDGSASTDPDGDPLTYSWVQTGGPTVTLTGANSVAPSFTAPPKTNSVQTLTFELTVNDPTGASSTAAVTITVTANQLPTADAGPDQSVNGTSSVTLDGSGSTDPDGDPINYSWVQTGGPAVTLVNANSVNPTFVAPTATASTQTLSFQLTVDDGVGSNSAGSRIAPPNPQQDTVEITILANSPPVADAGADQGPIDAGQTVTLDGSGSSDPDGDAINFVWTQLSGTPVTLTGGTSSAPTFVAPVVNGTEDLVFSLIVDDGQAQSTPDTVTISVRAVGSVTIIQRVIGGDAAVTFTSDIAALNGSLTTAGGSAQVSATEIAAGSYNVSVNDIRSAGFALTDIACNDTDSVANIGARSVALELAPGEDLVCTFTSTNSRGAAQAAIADFLTGRNALIMSHQPDLQRRLDRLTGIEASGGSATAYGIPIPGSGSLPFAMSLASGQASMSTSLAQVSGALAPQDRSSRPFDIWGEVFFSRAQLGNQKANFRIFHLGADYRIGEDVLVGALAEFDDFDDRDALEAGEAEGSGFLIGPYVMARIAPDLFAEVRAAWGSSDNVVNPLGTFTDAFDTSRSYYSGSLVGQFDIGKRTQVRPELTVRYLDETQQAYTDSLGVPIPEQSVGQGDFSFRPRLQHAVATGSGWTLRPFVEAEGIYTFGTNANTVLENGLRARIEGGLDVLSSNGIRASFGAFHDGIGADNFESSGVHASISFSF